MTDDDDKQWKDRITLEELSTFKAITFNGSPFKLSGTYYFHALTKESVILDETGIELEHEYLDSVRQDIVEAILESTMEESEQDDGSTIIGFVVADAFGRTVLEIPRWEMMSHCKLLHGGSRGAA